MQAFSVRLCEVIEYTRTILLYLCTLWTSEAISLGLGL